MSVIWSWLYFKLVKFIIIMNILLSTVENVYWGRPAGKSCLYVRSVDRKQKLLLFFYSYFISLELSNSRRTYFSTKRSFINPWILGPLDFCQKFHHYPTSKSFQNQKFLAIKQLSIFCFYIYFFPKNKSIDAKNAKCRPNSSKTISSSTGRGC